MADLLDCQLEFPFYGTERKEIYEHQLPLDLGPNTLTQS